jgi:hypothetical protein
MRWRSRKPNPCRSFPNASTSARAAARASSRLVRSERTMSYSRGSSPWSRRSASFAAPSSKDWIPPRYYLQSKHGSIDDGQSVHVTDLTPLGSEQPLQSQPQLMTASMSCPCNQSDTPLPSMACMASRTMASAPNVKPVCWPPLPSARERVDVAETSVAWCASWYGDLYP